MLPSQRALFDIPREICYLNAASWSPLPIATQDAGRAGVARKGQPWLIDPALPAALRKQGAMLLVDATHAAGVMTIDVRSLDPDFLVFPTYKWLLGPYARAFLYVAKRRQDGVPLEQTSYGRRAITSEQESYYRDTEFVAGARRFDMGARDHFISLEMASIGIAMMAEWGCEAVQGRLRGLTARLADQLRHGGVTIPDAAVRAPHILSVQFPAGMPARLIERLAAERVYRPPRVGRVPISPPVYNNEEDIH